MSVRHKLNHIDGEHPYQVMVVDEQDTFRRKVRDILHAIGGFQVVAETTSCRMALETVARLQIDLVIAEFTLGDGDGVTLTTCLKQLPQPPHVIIFSTTLLDPILLQLVLAGADGFMTKDTPTRDIIKAFKNFERGGPAMQPAITTNIIQLLVEQCKTAEAHASERTDALTIDPAGGFHQFSNGRTFSPVPGNGTIHAGELSYPPHLSPQEEKVFALLRQGQRNKQIAANLAISPYTVSKHVQNILRKLGVVNRTQAAAYTSFEG